MAPKIALTGASGMLGRELYAQLVTRFGEENVVGYCGRRRTNAKWTPLDLVDHTALLAALERDKPDVIVHSAAIRRPDAISNDAALANNVNVAATETIAQYVQSHPGAYMVFLSTDYVFDGRHPPYAEEAPTSPLNDYAVQKVKGEQIVCTLAPRELTTAQCAYSKTGIEQSCVLRVPIMYGRVEYLGEGAVDDVYKTMLASAKGTPLKLDDYHQRYPLHVADAAKAVVHLLEQRAEVRAAMRDLHKTQHPTTTTGIYQWRGEERLTKYGMALIMANVFAHDIDEFVAVGDAPPPEAAASRPHDACMLVSRMTTTGMANGYSFKDGIRHALQGMK